MTAAQPEFDDVADRVGERIDGLLLLTHHRTDRRRRGDPLTHECALDEVAWRQRGLTRQRAQCRRATQTAWAIGGKGHARSG